MIELTASLGGGCGNPFCRKNTSHQSQRK